MRVNPRTMRILRILERLIRDDRMPGIETVGVDTKTAGRPNKSVRAEKNAIIGANGGTSNPGVGRWAIGMEDSGTRAGMVGGDDSWETNCRAKSSGGSCKGDKD